MIEYNCRLGDPETEVVIPRIKNDLADLLLAVADRKVNELSLITDPRSAAATVAVSGGYPGIYTKGKKIEGIAEETIEDSLVFHAGTLQQNGNVITNGGRVLVVTAFGSNIREAAEQSVYMMEQLYFEDMKYRGDIGYEFC